MGRAFVSSFTNASKDLRENRTRRVRAAPVGRMFALDWPLARVEPGDQAIITGSRAAYRFSRPLAITSRWTSEVPS